MKEGEVKDAFERTRVLGEQVEGEDAVKPLAEILAEVATEYDLDVFELLEGVNSNGRLAATIMEGALQEAGITLDDDQAREVGRSLSGVIMSSWLKAFTAGLSLMRDRADRGASR